MTYKNHLSKSAYKNLTECAARQIAIDLGEWKQETTIPMLIGSYVDAYFSGTLDEFKAKNPQIYKKDGTLYASMEPAEAAIKTIEADPLLLTYVKGDKMQYEVNCTIGGATYKGFIDSLHTDRAIVDLKVVADLYAKVCNNEQHKYVSWIEAYGYDRQGAIYQEAIYQQTGKRLPFFLAVVTKQTPPDKAVIQIPQGRIDVLLEEMEKNSKELVDIRSGLIPAKRCEKCEFCRKTKKLKKTNSMYEFEP
jgi:hypothetical protein